MSAPPFLIEEFSERRANTLCGFAKVRLPSGVIFHDVAIHRKNSAAWASPSSKPKLGRDGLQQKDATGKPQRSPIISFATPETRQRFSEAVIEAMRVSHPDILA